MSGNDILTVPAEISRLPEVLAFIDERLEAAGCPVRTQIQIDVAVEELYVNIAHYAYSPGKGKAAIRTAFDPETRVFEIEFRDRGNPFDPLARPDPDVTLSAEKRRIGGLGIFMAKKSLDELVYSREDGENILRARKRI